HLFLVSRSPSMIHTMRITAWLAAAMLAATSARAQTRATAADLTGIVYDQSHAVLPGATMTATNTATNQTRSATTDAVGHFTIPALPPGEYAVKAELPGFATETQSGVALRIGTEVALEFTLKIAATEQQVTVGATPPVVDVEQTAVAT